MPTTVAASAPAADILRGTTRLMLELDLTSLPEFSLANGRRVDLMALGRDGRFVAVEIKSCRADFMADQKWPDYLAYADRFFFAVAPDFPIAILPPDEGLILADRYEATLIRPARERPLPPARRRALTLRFARTAAFRLQGLADLPAEEIP